MRPYTSLSVEVCESHGIAPVTTARSRCHCWPPLRVNRRAVMQSGMPGLHVRNLTPMRSHPQPSICFSMQVWVVGELHDDKKLHWRADSDSELTKACLSRYSS